MAYFVEMAQTNASVAGTLNANMPDHLVDDYLIAYVTVDSGTITLPAGWAALPSAPANPVSNGTITYLAYVKATSTAMTFSGVTVADAYTCGIYCFRDVDTTTPFDGVTPLNASAGAAAVTVTCSAVTTTTANALVVYLCAFDGTTPQAVSNPGVMWIDGFDATGTTATTSSHQAAAWYITRTAGASPTATFLCNASAASTRVTFALRNKSGGRVPAYIDDVSSPATMLTPCHHTAAVNNVTFTGTLTNTASVNGKTVSASAPTLGADFGINPYANAVGRTAAITAATALQGFEVTLTGGRNLSTGLLMGSLIALNPKSGTFGLGSTKQGGLVCRIGSGASNWEAHQIAAKDSNVTTEQRYVFAIKPGDLTTDYGTPGGAVNTAAVTYLQFLMNCPAFAANIYLSELHQVFTQVIAGGDATTPINIDSLAAVGKSFRLPVFQKAGAAGIVSFAPIQIGGGDAVNFQVDSGVIQFPKIYDPDGGELALHVPAGTLGLSLAGKSGDVVKLTNSLVTAPSLYYFEINAAATSAATWDLAGTTIIGAVVTLRPVMSYTDVVFSGCQSVTTNGSSIVGCSFKDSMVVLGGVAELTAIEDSSFASTQFHRRHPYALTLNGAADTATLNNLDFAGYSTANGTPPANTYLIPGFAGGNGGMLSYVPTGPVELADVAGLNEPNKYTTTGAKYYDASAELPTRTSGTFTSGYELSGWPGVAANQAFTIQFWAKRRSNSGNVITVLGGSSQLTIRLGVTGDSFEYYLFGSRFISHTAVSVGTWHHYALTRAASSGVVRLYINGVQVGTHNGDATDATGAPTKFMSVAGVTTTNTAWVQDFQYISGTDLYGGNSFTPPGALFEKRAIYVPATTGTFTLNVAGGNTPGVFTNGATVNVVNSATKTFTGLPSGTEVRVRRGSKTLATDPNVTTGSYAFTYAPDDRGATVQFTLPGYVFEDIVVTLNATSQELPIVSSPDPSYSAT